MVFKQSVVPKLVPLFILILSLVTVSDGQVDTCNPNPCKNNGHCRSYEDSYSCLCSGMFTGQDCTSLSFIASIGIYDIMSRQLLPFVHNVTPADLTKYNAPRLDSTVTLEPKSDSKHPSNTYEWTLNSTTLNPTQNSNVIISNVNGRLTISKGTLADVGEYQLFISNEFGAMFSNKVKLEFSTTGSYISPNIPILVSMTENEPYLLPCPPRSYSNIVTYVWQILDDNDPEDVDDTDLDFAPRILSEPSGDLLFSYAYEDDFIALMLRQPGEPVKSLRCRTIDRFGNSVLGPQILFTVNKPASQSRSSVKFYTKPSGLYTLATDDQFYVNCTAGGRPVPDILWYKNNALIANQPDLFGFEKYNRTLRLGSLKSVTHDGNYKCVADNGIHREETSFTIKVIDKVTPLYSKEHDDYKNMEIKSGKHGGSVTLPCNTTGGEIISRTWYYNGEALQYISKFANRWSAEASTGALTITNLQLKDFGFFQCVVRNKVSENYMVSFLVVTGAPLPPYSVNLTDCANYATNITWGVFFPPGLLPPDGFIIEMASKSLSIQSAKISDYYKLAEVSDDSARSYLVKKLKPFHEFYFRVRAKNQVGVGFPSYALGRCITNSRQPSLYPEKLSGLGHKDKQLNISWRALNVVDWAGPYCHYRLYHRENVSGKKWIGSAPGWDRVEYGGCAESGRIIKGLKANTVYEIRIRVENSEGLGPISPIISVRSGQSPPVKPPTNQTDRALLNVTLSASHLLVNVSDSFVINCTVIGGPDDLNITWSKSGKAIGLSHRTKVETGLRHSRLTVRDVMAEDEGNYVCQAIKGIQNGTASTIIEVVPVLEIKPRTVTKRVGDEATFTCDVVSGLRQGASVVAIEVTNDKNEIRHQEMNFTATNLQIPEGGESHVRKFFCEMSLQQKVLSRSAVAELIIIQPEAPKCPEERLDGVLWSATAAGGTDIKPCPKGASGTALRYCSEEVKWKDGNFVGCSSRIYVNISNEIKAITEGFESHTTARQVLSQLANATQTVPKNDTKRPPEIFGGDLVIAVNVLVTLADYNSKKGNVSTEEDTENFAQVASNLLDSTNQITWLELEKLNQGQGRSLVKAMDAYGLGVADTFTGSADSRTVETKNLVMRIDRAKKNSSLRTGGLFVAYNQSSIHLPPDAFKSPQDSRVITLVYLTLNNVLPLGQKSKDDKDDDDDDKLSPNTTIVSSTIVPRPQAVLKDPVKIVLQNRRVDVPSGGTLKGKCVFWRPGETPIWQTSGCRLEPSETDISKTTCICDHLTIFAAIMDPYGKPPEKEHKKALEIISIVGCSISLLAVIITMAVTVFFWRAVKSPRAKVLLNLCAAVAVSCILVITEKWARNNTVVCSIVAALLHYFLLALFCWMLCEGVLLYILLVKVFGGKAVAEEKVKYFYMFGWGCPVIIVAISLAVTQADGYGSPEACWLDVPSGLVWAFIAPAIVIILINFVMFILAIRQTMGTRHVQNKTQVGKVKAGVKASAVILPLLGITWVFGLLSFSSSTVVFKYIFAIANSLQGLMIFIFHCLLNKQIKDAIKRRHEKSSLGGASTTPKTKHSTLQNAKRASSLPSKAPGNKRRSNQAQNNHEMVDLITREKNGSKLTSSTGNKDAANNIPDDENNEQLRETKVLPRAEENEIRGRDEARLNLVERRSSSSSSSSNDSDTESAELLRGFNPEVNQEEVIFAPVEGALSTKSDDPTSVRKTAKKLKPREFDDTVKNDEDSESSHGFLEQVRRKIHRGSYEVTKSGDESGEKEL